MEGGVSVEGVLKEERAGLGVWRGGGGGWRVEVWGGGGWRCGGVEGKRETEVLAGLEGGVLGLGSFRCALHPGMVHLPSPPVVIGQYLNPAQPFDLTGIL